MLAGIAAVKDAVPDMVVTTEVCGCSWTDHGECGLRDRRDRLDLPGTFTLMAAMAVAHDQAGAMLYGPFKALMGTNPARGHRRGLQLESARADREVLLQADRWLPEGADSLTLQPIMTCTDLLVRLRSHTRVPLIAYSTSGEFAALSALGDAGMLEYHAGLKRAGADLILTYAAERLARLL